MDDIQFVHLSEIEEEKIIELMNNEDVGRQMPLIGARFTHEQCSAFLQAKQQLWRQHGYGPYAFVIKGEFAGWGGLQPENGEADFALVLHPDFWGWGRKIFDRIKELAFKQMELSSFTILFPPGRTNSKAVFRMGFIEDGHLSVNGQVFVRYRLESPSS
ncbi:MAG: GNAT family N-acetyltransferase [Methyloligellaceae bacterium]